MTVYTLNPLQDRRWADFVSRHPRAAVFHTPGWLDAIHRTYGYEPVVYTTCAPTESLTNGVVFCRINSWLTGRRMVSVPFADHCEPLVEREEDRSEIFTALRRLVEQAEWKYIEIRPRASALLTEPGVTRDRSYGLHTLDLRPPTEELFRRLHKDSIQRKIRRAEREGVLCEEGRSEALLRQFYKLLLLTRRRHRLPPQPFGWFLNLCTCLGDRLTIRLASKDGRPLAAILTLRHGDTLVYKYGASDATVHNLGAMPFLLWAAIRDAKETGLMELDLGRSDSDNSGLMIFKQRLGATASMLTYARWSSLRARHAAEGRAMHVAKQLFTWMPDGLLTAAGRLLYRHIA